MGGPAASVITAGEVGKKACPRLGLTEARCYSVWKGGWCPRAVTWVRTGVVVRVYDDFYTGFCDDGVDSWRDLARFVEKLIGLGLQRLCCFFIPQGKEEYLLGFVLHLTVCWRRGVFSRGCYFMV